VRQRPWLGIAASIALHLLVFGGLLLLGVPSSPVEVKRGEPLFVELPQSDELAARGAPSAAATPAAPPKEEAPPAPKTAAAPPAPPVAKAPPAPRAAPAPKAPPSPREASPPARRAPTPASPPPSVPEPSSVASAPAPQPAPPAPETPPAPEPPRVAATPPAPAEPPAETPPAPTPEVRPRETAPASPPPRVAAVPPQREPSIDGLSALRRRGPGAGGAGGRGESWSGIEGEPVPLDSTDPRYNDYLDRVRRMIKEKWGYPCIKDAASGHCDYKSARLMIVFGILKDGRVPMLEVTLQSGYSIYDDYAANAIRLAAPFPPVPQALMATAAPGSAGVKIVAAFQYVLVESSLTNILR
jgi:outer membrane biosynthesis protein TonB